MRRVLAYVLVVIAAVMIPAAKVYAQGSVADTKLAEELAQQAFDAYSKGEFGTAISTYQKAYQTSPIGAILFNIANIFDKKLDDKNQALDYYLRYLHAADTEPELV